MRRLLMMVLVAVCLAPEAGQAQATADQLNKLSLEALTTPAPGGNPGPTYRHRSYQRSFYHGLNQRAPSRDAPARGYTRRRSYSRYAAVRRHDAVRRPAYRASSLASRGSHAYRSTGFAPFSRSYGARSGRYASVHHAVHRRAARR